MSVFIIWSTGDLKITASLYEEYFFDISNIMDITIKPCKTEDLDALRKLSRETFFDAFVSYNTKENMDRYLDEAYHPEKLLRELLSPGSWFYFLYSGNDLAGYLKLNEAPSQTDINDDESLEIERIYIHKNYQGKGFGRYLMNTAEEKAQEKNKQYIWLGVWEKNESALGFYRTMGFIPFKTHAFRLGDELQTDILMKKTCPYNSR